MKVAKNRVVSVTYYITDLQGEQIERIDLPVSFIYNRQSGLFDKVHRALEGLEVGRELTVELTPREGFGDWNPDFAFTDAIENVPPQFRHIGAQAEFENSRGEMRPFTVTHVDSGTVTLDSNHPFAGKTVQFHIRIVDVRQPTAEELQHGVSPHPGALH